MTLSVTKNLKFTVGNKKYLVIDQTCNIFMIAKITLSVTKKTTENLRQQRLPYHLPKIDDLQTYE